MFLFLPNNLIMLIILQHYAHQKHVLQYIQEKVVRHDSGCLELYASCLANTDGFGAYKTFRTEACRHIRTHPTKYDDLHEPRKTPEELSAISHSRLYSNCRSRKNGQFDGARTPYSRKITHYASIMPSAAKHILFPLLCRHNFRQA